MRTLLLTLLIAAGAAAGEKNLLRNGGFDKDSDGWFWVTNSRRASIDVKKGALHVRKTGGFPADVLGQSFDLTKQMRGGRLTVTAKIRAEKSQNTWLKLYIYNAAGDVVIDEVDVAQVRGSFGWKTFQRAFAVPKDATSAKVLLQVFMGGEIWIDAIEVTWGEAKKKERKQAKPLDKRTQDWLDENAVVLASNDPTHRGFRDLAPLKRVLKDVRLVQLGENTHGDGACFLAKCRLVKWLHEEMGFNVVAWESGLFECDRANELIKPQSDSKDAMRASIFKIWHTRRTLPLFRYLHTTRNTRTPLILAGFDPQQSGELAKDFVGRLTNFLREAGIDKPATFNFLAKGDQRMQQEGYRGEVTFVQAIGKTLKLFLDEQTNQQLVKKHGQRKRDFWFRSLQNFQVCEELRRTKDATKAYNLRDEWMGRNLIWLADHRYKGEKIVVWAATSHIAHNRKSIQGKGAAAYKRARCMGEYVHEHFGKACYTVGFAAHGGRGGRWFQGSWDVPPPEAGSIEDTLYRWGKPMVFLDFRAKNPFDKTLLLGVMAYTRDFRARWPRVIDGLVYIEEMVPAAFMGD